MYYELYIDVFFLENFMLDSLLLLVVNRVMNNGRSYSRILLGGRQFSDLSCGCCSASFSSQDACVLYTCQQRDGVHGASDHASVAVCTGIFAFVCSSFSDRRSNAAVPPVYALRECVLCSGCRKLCAHSEIVESTFAYVQTAKCDPQGDSEKPLKALLDTGNELRDCYTGEPVNIIAPETAAELSDRIEMEKGFRLIPYHCVNGESVMKVFRVKKMCVHMEEDRWIENALVGIGEESLSGDREYEMILNPAIFSG